MNIKIEDVVMMIIMNNINKEKERNMGKVSFGF